MSTTHPPELNNGVSTSWIPLTSAWPSQAACNTEAWARFGIQADSDFWPYIYDPAYEQSVQSEATPCLPPEATSWWDGGSTVSSTITSYSLGPIICPEAYTTYSTIPLSGSSTSIICCPSNYDFTRHLQANSGIDGVCASTISVGQSLIYASPLSDSYTEVITTFTEVATMIAVPVEGYNFVAAAVTTSSLQTGTGTGSSMPSSSTTNISSSGLSTGAKAGIGAGIGAVVLLAAALGAFWFFKRKRYQATPTVELPSNVQTDNGGIGPGPNGFYGPYKGPGQAPVEVESKTVLMHELGGSSPKPIEMYA